ADRRLPLRLRRVPVARARGLLRSDPGRRGARPRGARSRGASAHGARSPGGRARPARGADAMKAILVLIAGLVVLFLVAAVPSQGVPPSPAWGASPAPAATPSAGAAALGPARRTPDHVLVQLFRGRTRPSRDEVSITTIFRESTFTVIDDA